MKTEPTSGVDTDKSGCADSSNTCRYCKNYVSYCDAYWDDPLEPLDFGFCDLEGFNCKPVTWETKACTDFIKNK